MMDISNETLGKHADLISQGHETHALNESLAERLCDYAEEKGVQTEIIERNGGIIVRAMNHHLLREART